MLSQNLAISISWTISILLISGHFPLSCKRRMSEYSVNKGTKSSRMELCVSSCWGHANSCTLEHRQPNFRNVTYNPTTQLFLPEVKRNSKIDTYNSGYSLVVTHLTTNPPVRCLNRAERTGSLVFNVLWSYVTLSPSFIPILKMRSQAKVEISPRSEDRGELLEEINVEDSRKLLLPHQPENMLR